MKNQSKETRDKFDLLKWVEWAGNALPHPAVLFAIFCILVVLLSGLLQLLGVTATYQQMVDGVLSDVTIGVESLMSQEGVQYMFTSAITNFSTFAPLGVVLVSMLGVGVAERTGLIGVLLKKLVTSTPRQFVTAVVVFAGVMSSIASDAGYVVVIPLGAIIFLSFDRNPLAGIAAAFCGVSGGFSANLFPGTVDAMLGTITEEATTLSKNGFFPIRVTDNWYFIIASVFLITLIGTLVTEKIVEPRLGTYHGTETAEMTQTTTLEKKGLRYALIVCILYLLFVLWSTLPGIGFLRNPDTGELLKSPFMDSIMIIIVLFFFLPGAAYGYGAKTIKNAGDIINMMSEAMASMGSYIVLVFFAAQFIKYFSYTNIGTIIAVKGADFLSRIGAGGIFLVIGFVILVAFINLFMGSASAKWAILAPIFVPMFMNLGYHPALIQMAYRIGDSITNIVTPLMSYFALIVVYCTKYDKKAGSGTLTSMMLPYTLFLLIGWILLLMLFHFFQIPLGPGA